MALARGTRLGPYQIADQLGEGRVAEVYRATDTRLEPHGCSRGNVTG